MNKEIASTIGFNMAFWFAGVLLLIILYAFGVIGFFTLFILIFLSALVVGLWGNNQKKKIIKEHAKKLEDEIAQVENFTPTKKQVGSWGLIAIDDNSKQIAIKEREGPVVKYSYYDILSCEIVEDGVTTYQKSRTIGRSIVGGVIAGGAGAVIGGLSGKEKENREIKSLVFRIVFKSTNKPIVKLWFIDALGETLKMEKSINLSDPYYGQLYKEALDSVKDWRDTFEIIIDSVNSEKKSTSNSYLSVSDELIKLNDLKEKGILTAAEFEQQKRKILS